MRPHAQHRSRPGSRKRLGFDTLELRRLLATSNVISGVVYGDTNHDGLLDDGETPLTGSTIELKNAQGVIVGTTTTNSVGAYQFTIDSTISTAPVTESESITYPVTATPVSQSGTVPQFDPTLGTLTSVEITETSVLNDNIRVENTGSSPATLTANVNGSAVLTGPGTTSLTVPTADSEVFDATAFDGTVDFGGTSGHDYGTKVITGTQTVSLTDPTDLAAYLGTGTVSFTQDSNATSSVTGSGNVVQVITTSAGGSVDVVYHYTPSNSLQPGNYTIVQVVNPPGYTNGLNSSNGAVIPNSFGTNLIAVTLGTTDSTNNNFGELQPPSSVAGFVYNDSNDNGVKDANEAGIGGVTVVLTGTDVTGKAITETMTTGTDGSYDFTNLLPGTYTLTKTPPAGYLEGMGSIGTQGGTVASPDVLGNIVLGPNINGVNNNFGELLPSQLSGFVYFDANNDGIKEASEYGIAHAVVTLTGTDDLGDQVTQVVSTGYYGDYDFANLRPGSYTITLTQPTPFREGKSTIGSQGGTAAPNKLTAVPIGQAVNGVNNNFGELAKKGCKLLGLTEYHIKPAHQLAASRIGPLIRYYVPSLVPAITRPALVHAASASHAAVSHAVVSHAPVSHAVVSHAVVSHTTVAHEALAYHPATIAIARRRR